MNSGFSANTSEPVQHKKSRTTGINFISTSALHPIQAMSYVSRCYLLTTRLHTPTTKETLSLSLTTLASIHFCCKFSILLETFCRILLSSSSICCSSRLLFALRTSSSRRRRARDLMSPEKADHLRPARSRRGLKYVSKRSADHHNHDVRA